jgi:hypothetical protein
MFGIRKADGLSSDDHVPNCIQFVPYNILQDRKTNHYSVKPTTHFVTPKPRVLGA